MSMKFFFVALLMLGHTTTASADALIQSESDLVTYVRDLPNNSPLQRLSAEDLADFTASMTFNKSGLTGFKYTALIGLSVSEAHAILSIFGADHLAARVPGLKIESKLDAELVERYAQRGETDHFEYACVDRATCRSHSQHICMSGC